MYYSPLRYPGGKGKLAPLIETLLRHSNHEGGTYIEPFAGGAAVALELLEKEIVNEIVINDYDKGIYSFWRAILTEPDRFINDIRTVSLSVDQWEKQRGIIQNNRGSYSYELGFATFYLNRTNRSGIIKGGIIGGKDQSGVWKLDARFGRERLVSRIAGIVSHKNNIHLYNKDFESFMNKYLPRYGDNVFIYIDPPYYEKGKQLYLNFYTHEDHLRIERLVRNLDQDWVMTYDNVDAIRSIYKDYYLRSIRLNYSAGTHRAANEIMIFNRQEMIPDNHDLAVGYI